jgi:hypothetical protein
LRQQEAELFSEPGYWNLRKELEPTATQKFNQMLQENPAYQSYIKQADQVQGNINLLQSAKQRAIETGQAQSVQFAEPDGVTRWSLLIEPPGKETGPFERQAYHARFNVDPVPVSWVDQYQKDYAPRVQQDREYATVAGLFDLAANTGRQDLIRYSDRPISEQMAVYRQELLGDLAHQQALKERDRRGALITEQLAEIEKQYGPRIDAFDPAYEQLYSQLRGLRSTSDIPVLAPTQPSTVVPTTPPSTPAAPTAPSTPSAPTTPIASPIPVPTIPAYTTPQAPQAPVSNLTPQPLPGVTPRPTSIGGIPQPTLGMLPQYQSPTVQAAPTMQQQQQPQQQIQYGPIGQAATSSADLLKNLLASSQQSMPFDFNANNPYLMNQQPVQFFAEGGEVQQLGPLDYAWNRLVQDQWSKEQEAFQAQKADYEARLAEANRQAALQGQQRAQQQFESAKNQAIQSFAPEVNQYRRDIEGLEKLIRGEVDSVLVRNRLGGGSYYRAEDLASGNQTPEAIREYAIAPMQTKLARLTNPAVIENEALRLLVEEGTLGEVYSPNYTYALGTVLGSDLTVNDAPGSTRFAETRGELLNKAKNSMLSSLADKYRIENEGAIAFPVYNQMLQAEEDWSRRVNDLYAGYDRTTSQAVKDLYAYNRTRDDEIERELSGLRGTESYTPEMAEIINRARQAEGQYLFGPEYTYTPEGQQRGREIYRSVFEEGLKNRPILIPSTPTSPTSSTSRTSSPVPLQPHHWNYLLPTAAWPEARGAAGGHHSAGHPTHPLRRPISRRCCSRLGALSSPRSQPAACHSM